MTTDKMITDIILKVKSLYPSFLGIYFFGSRNKNKQITDSDYDLLLSFQKKLSWQEKNQIYDIIADVEINEGIVIDAKLYHDLELKNIWTPFRENVMNEGTYYAA